MSFHLSVDLLHTVATVENMTREREAAGALAKN